MRISDWSSDVCSSDLHHVARGARDAEHALSDADALEVVELAGIGDRAEGNDLEGRGITTGGGHDVAQAGYRLGQPASADGYPPVSVVGDVPAQLRPSLASVAHRHAGPAVGTARARLRPTPPGPRPPGPP